MDLEQQPATEVEPTAAPATTEVAEPAVEAAPAAEPVAEAPAAEPEPEAAPEPDPFDTFDWDTYDYDSGLDAFPEEQRRWLDRYSQGLNSRHERALQSIRDEAEINLAMYEALRDGREDPKIQKLQADLEDRNKAIEAANARVEAAEKRADAVLEENLEVYMRKFRADYKDHLADEGFQQRLVSTIDSTNLEPHEAAEVVLLGDAAIAKAVELSKSEIPPEFIVEHVKLAHRTTVTAPREPTSVQRALADADGHTPGPRSPRKKPPALDTWADIEAAKTEAIRRNLAKHG